MTYPEKDAIPVKRIPRARFDAANDARIGFVRGDDRLPVNSTIRRTISKTNNIVIFVSGITAHREYSMARADA
jgi:hypothetical protein